MFAIVGKPIKHGAALEGDLLPKLRLEFISLKGLTLGTSKFFHRLVSVR